MSYVHQPRFFWCMKLAVIALSLFLRGSLLFADGISVNGSCEFGACSPVGVLPTNGSVNDSFSLVYTFANSDRYQITGVVSAGGYSVSPFIGFSRDTVTATFQGNNSGTTWVRISCRIDFLQAFQTPLSAGTSDSGFESIAGFFSGPISSASSAEHQFFSNGGTAMVLIGPFSPPNPFFGASTKQPFSFGPITSLDANFTFTFGAGSGVGSAIDVCLSSPEPPAGPFAGAVLLAAFISRRFRSQKIHHSAPAVGPARVRG